jgi:hypothetical protein
MRYLFSILFLATSGFGQEALATFYSTGSAGKEALKTLRGEFGVPGEYGFMGWVFDGDRRLAVMQRGRFMTLHLPPGQHTFAPGNAWSAKHPSQKVLLSVTLEAGGRYFLRLSETHKGVWALQIPFQHIEQVACETARQEASKTEPIKAKRVEKEVRSSLENSVYFPNCN